MRRINWKAALLLAVLGAILIANLWGQIAPGYIDIVSVPSAPGNPSINCLAGNPCNRIYVLGASGGTGSTGTLSCKTTNGGSCAPAGASGSTGATGPSGASGPTGATGISNYSTTFVISGGGSVITTGATHAYWEAENAAATGIYKVVTTGTATAGPSNCSITVDIWKAAAAIPTSANKISASDPATLSTAQYSVDTTLTGWTTTVAAGDVFSASVATVTGCISATVQVWWK